MKEQKRPRWQLAIIDLKKKRGALLKPEEVVQEARDPRSPLHPKFEWRDGKAAQKYRLWQARQLIEQVDVEIVSSGTVTQTVPAFVSLEVDRKKGGGYRSTVEVLSNRQLRAHRLKQAIAELDRWCTQYRDLNELSGVIKARERLA